MAESHMQVRPVRVIYLCDECGEEVSTTGEMHPVLPPIYIHICPNGHVFKSRKRYPRIEYNPTY